MNRTEKLNHFCSTSGLKKYVIADQLGVPAQMLTYLLRIDIDGVITRIDELSAKEDAPSRKRKAS